MRTTRLLIPALALAATLIATPALADPMDGPTSDAAGIAAAEDDETAKASDPEPENTAPAAADAATDPSDAATDPGDATDPSGLDAADAETTPAESAPDDTGTVVPDTTSPIPVTPEVVTEAAPEVADAINRDVTITYTEVDPANGIVEIHGTGTPGAYVGVTQWSHQNPSVLFRLTQVAADGTWSIDTVNAFNGRRFDVEQAHVAGVENMASVEVKLSTDNVTEPTVEVRDADPESMTAVVFGTGVPGAWIGVWINAMHDAPDCSTTVAADGTYSIAVSGLDWGQNYIGIIQEFQGLAAYTDTFLVISHPAYVPATVNYTVVDPAAKTVILHGTGTPGGEIWLRGWVNDQSHATSVGSFDIRDDGTWSSGIVDTTVYGPHFVVYQRVGLELTDSVEITVQFPANRPAVVAPIAMAPAPPAAAPVRPVETRHLANTGTNAAGVASLSGLAGMLVLGGAAAIVARRRLAHGI